LATTIEAKWFSRVVWLGIVVNMLFIVPQVFAPDYINITFGQPVGGPNVWNRAHGMMVLALSIFYVPAALEPLRNPGYSWLLVLSRLLAACLWWCISRSNPAFLQALATDGGFGIVEGILLQLALPAESRISGASIARVMGDLFRCLGEWLRRPAVRAGLAVFVVLAAIVGYILWDHLVRTEPDISYPSVEEHYKHGAIGLGPGSQIPYWIWKVMPEVFADKLPGPGGWASLGLIMEPGQDLPVGFSKRHLGYDAVEANCALCHTGEFRRTPNSQPELILGGPAHTLDLEGFQRFLYGCAADARFAGDVLMSAIEKMHPMSFVESQIYRNLVIPVMKQQLLEQKAAYSWQESRPIQGRGRTDTFNPTKFNVFHMPDDGTIGTVDLPQVWNQRPRIGLNLHWDGNNNNINERNYAAAMAIGATPKSVIIPSFKRVTDFLLDLKPPAWPFELDKSAATRGKGIYDQHCAECHEFGKPKTGQVDAIEQIGTDRHRLDSFSASLVEKFHAIDNPPFVFDAYHKTNGYANVPIDGIWARAPYLHNGSAPNLWALLQPPQNRPVIFYIGYDVYDPKNVGFVTDGPEASKAGFRLDTGLPGNGNQGHLYGTTLPDKEKWDLIEYLKTL
jgi:mono/diheme cytochrome c family protein